MEYFNQRCHIPIYVYNLLFSSAYYFTNYYNTKLKRTTCREPSPTLLINKLLIPQKRNKYQFILDTTDDRTKYLAHGKHFE